MTKDIINSAIDHVQSLLIIREFAEILKKMLKN